MNSAAIPFFSDLPPKAVKAACRLWDAIHRADYNGVQAYNDFCHDLTLAAIQPPARGVVKRWVAGVQARLIDRPAPAWDKVGAAVVDALVAHPETGKPVQPKMKVCSDPETRLVTGVSVEYIQNEGTHAEPHPFRTEDGVLIANELDASALQNPVPLDGILSALLGAKPIDLTPYSATAKEVPEAAFMAVQAAAGRLLEENIIQLSQRIERTAREDTARMLRAVADEMCGEPASDQLDRLLAEQKEKLARIDEVWKLVDKLKGDPDLVFNTLRETPKETTPSTDPHHE